MKAAGRVFWVACILTIWAGIWWVQTPEDVLRYFLQAFLFAMVGLTFYEGLW